MGRTLDKEIAMEVAKTIMKQLGANNAFCILTGAKDFVGFSNGLLFRVPKCRDGINRIRITLQPNDTYLVEAFRCRGTTFVCVNHSEDVYADQLRAVFTKFTGIATKL
jgi:hypothetical protein